MAVLRCLLRNDLYQQNKDAMRDLAAYLTPFNVTPKKKKMENFFITIRGIILWC